MGGSLSSEDQGIFKVFQFLFDIFKLLLEFFGRGEIILDQYLSQKQRLIEIEVNLL